MIGLSGEGEAMSSRQFAIVATILGLMFGGASYYLFTANLAYEVGDAYSELEAGAFLDAYTCAITFCGEWDYGLFDINDASMNPIVGILFWAALSLFSIGLIVLMVSGSKRSSEG
jgi:hypothetical protein